jgi:transcriptional regulator with PAS, ATPase and Fis domain
VNTDAYAWINEFPGGITVCEADGTILAMNAKSAAIFEKDGGAALIGTNLFDCHPEPSRTKLRELLSSGKRNVYTIEKQGIKKLIYQSPWFVDGEYRGFVELSLELPESLPHFVRDKPKLAGENER